METLYLRHKLDKCLVNEESRHTKLIDMQQHHFDICARETLLFKVKAAGKQHPLIVNFKIFSPMAQIKVSYSFYLKEPNQQNCPLTTFLNPKTIKIAPEHSFKKPSEIFTQDWVYIGVYSRYE